MKTKSLSYVVIVLVLAGSFTALGVGKQAAANEQTFTLQFSEPKTSEITIQNNIYNQISMGSEYTYYVAGQPVLPMYVRTLEFPLGTTITSIDFIPQGLQTITVPNRILPAPQAVTLDEENPVAQYIADESIYSSAQYFPDNWFDYSTGGGLNNNMQHTMFLSIRTFPVRYNPATSTVQYIQDAQITVNYKLPAQPMTFTSTYKLVIIAPKAWASDLKKLVDDKVKLGITTNLTTLEDIYAKYTTGYDEPENIKLFIYDAAKNWGTQDVLLVGGYKGYLKGRGGRDTVSKGVTNWYLPVRYTDLDEGGSEHDPGFISDLYYADVFTSNGSFSSWDSNHDHVYAKWIGASHDIIDLYPDVAVGRIAARNKYELNIMLKKIITYEAAPADPSWFKTVVLVGGDSFDDRPYGINVPEGEYSTSFTYNESLRAAGFTATKLFATNHNKSLDTLTPTPKNIVREVSKGCGFLYFDGHGNPLSWNTHWLDVFAWGSGQTPGGLNAYTMVTLKNKDKLPVCIVGGCHNSMINISLIWSLDSKDMFTWVYGQPTPRSWSEWLVAKNKGGAIACIGNTGLGYGLVGQTEDGLPACISGLGGFVERTFFQAYNESASDKTLGYSWAGAITKYLHVWPGMAHQADCKTVEEWLNLGDPSLVIG